MMLVNNVNVEHLRESIERIKKDLEKAKKITVITGEWIFNKGEEPQFTAEIKFEKGSVILEADQPTPLDGGGTRSGPMHYCVYGLAACFTATFVTEAAMRGIQLRAVKTTADSHMDFSRIFGLSDNPVIEEVKFKLEVDSDLDQGELQELVTIAQQKCPAVYCLSNPVKFTVEVDKSSQGLGAKG